VLLTVVRDSELHLVTPDVALAALLAVAEGLNLQKARQRLDQIVSDGLLEVGGAENQTY
jgi:hypothetical protein